MQPSAKTRRYLIGAFVFFDAALFVLTVILGGYIELMRLLQYFSLHPLLTLPFAALISLFATFLLWRWDKHIEEKQALERDIIDIKKSIVDGQKFTTKVSNGLDHLVVKLNKQSTPISDNDLAEIRKHYFKNLENDK